VAFKEGTNSKLTFGPHIADLANRAKQRTGRLAPLLRNPALSYTTRSHIYKAMIRSQMSYAAPTWLHSATCHKKKLQIVQNHALRLLTGHERGTRTIQLHEDAEIPYLEDHLRRHQQLYWNRLREHPDENVHSIATEQPQRQVHKMPRLN